MKAMGTPRAPQTPSTTPASSEGKGSGRSFARARADIFDEGPGCVRLGDNLGQQWRVDRPTTSWAVVEHRHIPHRLELAGAGEYGDGADKADVEFQGWSWHPPADALHFDRAVARPRRESEPRERRAAVFRARAVPAQPMHRRQALDSDQNAPQMLIDQVG